MSDYMLGVDIGTTSTKAVLFDAMVTSSPIAPLDTRYSPLRPQPPNKTLRRSTARF
jgi:sugar (pentulose or hexulose) kinase